MKLLLISAFASASLAFTPSTFYGIRKAHLATSMRSKVGSSTLRCTAAQEIPGVSLPNLAPWRKNLDLVGWATEVRAIEKEFREGQGEKDVKHMKKLLNFSILMYVAGIALAGFCKMPWNPVAAILISTSICVRWTMIGHHVCHGGYNAQVGPDHRFHRGKFARGPLRRFVDWLDWMLPEAWDVEHNFLHHYELGEASDPDLVERNTHSIRVSRLPLVVKYLEMFALMTMWKWFYYSPNTLKEMYARQQQLAERRGETVEQPFVLPPAPGDFQGATKQATIKYAIAEAFHGNLKPTLILAKGLLHCRRPILTNLHSFTIIAPNHAGRDIYRFNTPVKVKSDEFYLRAVIGSTNYRTGGDVNDLLHGWLNYQIEHHMFPDMSMLSYQRMAPRVKAACQKYGVPYVQENVFKRLWKTLRIGTGQDSMLVWERGD